MYDFGLIHAYTVKHLMLEVAECDKLELGKIIGIKQVLGVWTYDFRCMENEQQ